MTRCIASAPLSFRFSYNFTLLSSLYIHKDVRANRSLTLFIPPALVTFAVALNHLFHQRGCAFVCVVWAPTFSSALPVRSDHHDFKETRSRTTSRAQFRGERVYGTWVSHCEPVLGFPIYSNEVREPRAGLALELVIQRDPKDSWLKSEGNVLWVSFYLGRAEREEG